MISRQLAQLCFVVVGLTAGPVLAAESASVLVKTMLPTKGEILDVVYAYGTAGPALDSSQTISLQIQGRVSRFLVTAGESVAAGQPLLNFSVSQSALGAFRQAQTALATAKIERDRIGQLRAQQLATKDQVTQADKAIADAQSQLDTLTRSGAGTAEIQVKAPFDGVVSSIAVAQGDTVSPGAPIMVLMRADGLVVTVGIEPSARLRVKRGDSVKITPLSVGGAPSQGSIARIDGILNPKTHLVDADVATKAKLLPGAVFATAITVGTFSGYILPRDAVLVDASGSYCFQVVSGKAKRVAVIVVGSDDQNSAVTGSINGALPLVIDGNYQLADGIAVRMSASGTSNTVQDIR